RELVDGVTGAIPRPRQTGHRYGHRGERATGVPGKHGSDRGLATRASYEGFTYADGSGGSGTRARDGAAGTLRAFSARSRVGSGRDRRLGPYVGVAGLQNGPDVSVQM